MAKFTYNGEDGRYYPSLAGGITPTPGEEYALDEAPTDGRWTPVDGDTTKPRRRNGGN